MFQNPVEKEKMLRKAQFLANIRINRYFTNFF